MEGCLGGNIRNRKNGTRNDGQVRGWRQYIVDRLELDRRGSGIGCSSFCRLKKNKKIEGIKWLILLLNSNHLLRSNYSAGIVGGWSSYSRARMQQKEGIYMTGSGNLGPIPGVATAISSSSPI